MAGDDLNSTKTSGVRAGLGSFPPTLQLSGKGVAAGRAVLGKIVAFKTLEKIKQEKDRASKRMVDVKKTFNILTLEVADCNIDGVVKGKPYALFAGGQLMYLLEIEKPLPDCVGERVRIEFTGQKKIEDKDHPYDGEMANQFEVIWPDRKAAE